MILCEKKLTYAYVKIDKLQARKLMGAGMRTKYMVCDTIQKYHIQDNFMVAASHTFVKCLNVM